MTIERADKQSMDNVDSLTIEQVQNGYIVHKALDKLGLNGCHEFRQPHVFPSKAALFAHLAEHFTHQAVSVAMDAAPPIAALRSDMRPATDPVGFTNFGRRE